MIEDDLGKIALGSYMLELADALTSEEAEAVDAYHVLARALRDPRRRRGEPRDAPIVRAEPVARGRFRSGFRALPDLR